MNYEKQGDKLRGEDALRAYRHAQNDALGKTPPDLDTWKRLQVKIIHLEMSQKGGRTKSQARTEANRRNIKRRWELYRAAKAMEQ